MSSEQSDPLVAQTSEQSDSLVAQTSEQSDPLVAQKRMFDANRVYLMDNLEPEGLIHPLAERGLISTGQMGRLADLAPTEKREKLIDIVYRGDEKVMAGFIEELRRDVQNAVADRLTIGSNTALVVSKTATHFAAHVDVIKHNIRLEGGLLARLERNQVITRHRREQIEATPGVGAQVERLLEMVKRGADENRIQGLIEALQATNQPHLAAVVSSGDKSLLVPPAVQAQMALKKHDLATALAQGGSPQIDRLVGSLIQEGTITMAQGDAIMSKATRYQKAECLVDILPSRPYKGGQRRLMDAAVAWEPLAAGYEQIGPAMTPDGEEQSARSDVQALQYWPYNVLPLECGDSHSQIRLVTEEMDDLQTPSVSTQVRPANVPRSSDSAQQSVWEAQGARPKVLPTSGPSPGRTAHHGPSETHSDKTTDRPTATSADPFSEYCSLLKDGLRKKAEDKSNTLNSEFGINMKGTFYNKLSISADIQGKTEQETLYKTEEYIRRSDNTLKSADVELNNIFDPVQEEESCTRVLMLGAAGSGKSSTALHVAHEWATDKMWLDTACSYLLECRELLSLIEGKREVSLADLLCQHHAPGSDSPLSQSPLLSHLGQIQHQVHMTIDGLDELAGWRELVESSPPTLTDVNTKAPVPVVIYNLILGNLLPGARLLVTSRPIAAASRKLFHKTIHVLGFSIESVRKCMQALCDGDTGMFDKIMEHITVKTQLSVHCVLPLACVIIGVALRQAFSAGGSGAGQMETLTQVFIWLVLFTIHRRSPTPDSRYDLTDSQRGALQRMAALAASGLFRPDTKIIFDHNDLRAEGVEEGDYGCGLMEISHDVAPTFSLERTRVTRGAFIHLAVQEFLAAVHWATTRDQGAQETAASYINTPRLANTRLFLAGLVGDPFARAFLEAVAPHVDNTLLAAGRRQLVSWLEQSASGDLGKLEVIQAMACLHEGRLGDVVQRLLHKRGEPVPRQKDGLLRRVKKALTRKAAEKSLDLSSIPGDLLPHHGDMVQRFLDKRGEPPIEKSLDLSSILDDPLPHHGDMVQRFLDKWGEPVPRQKEGLLRRLKKALTRKAEEKVIPPIEKSMDLDLSSIPGDLLPHQVAAVSYCLEHAPRLGNLNLTGNSLGDAGARVLAEGLRKATGLRALLLWSNAIGDDGARALGEALTDHQTLQELGLFMNSIGPEGARHLAEALRENTSLRVLNLGRNSFGPEGARHLAEALGKNTSLTDLRLGHNSIGPDGARHLAEALGKNTSLTDLSLEGNDITDEGGEHLARALRVNKTLKKIWLASDDLSDDLQARMKEEFGDRVYFL